MFRFQLNGSQVECDSVQELRSALGRRIESANGEAAPGPTLKKRGRKKAGPARSWELARQNVKPGETVVQARSRLSRERKARKAK